MICSLGLKPKAIQRQFKPEAIQNLSGGSNCPERAIAIAMGVAHRNESIPLPEP